jgi:hypothetical protein
MLGELERLHRRVDRVARKLERRHRERLECRRGCAGCCVDDISVFRVEAERIRRGHARLLREGSPHPPGACAFLDDEGGCRIYDVRPYVCRTQGLPLRWTEVGDDGAVTERRDICPLNDRAAEPLADLPRHACWTLGPAEGRLATLQVRHGGSPPERVRLRELFEDGSAVVVPCER